MSFFEYLTDREFIVYALTCLFFLGICIHSKNIYKVKKHLKMINDYSLPAGEIEVIARSLNVAIPRLGIFIPARNEAKVIENTLKHISKIDYPKERLTIYVIVDERERDDNVPEMTINIARNTSEFLNKEYGENYIKIVEVPKWYSGIFGDTRKTFSKSTKGRALNYCLQTLTLKDFDITSKNNKLDMIGILDADGRLHQNVLKEVAVKRMKHNYKILQGPVFQVNNFDKVSIVGIAAALELALHHLTELPSSLLKENAFQFLAGTNYFIDTVAIKSAGGWDQTALVEDAELALRLYSNYGIVGSWLNSPELEQTPANFSIYRKQRERWVRGHLSLVKQISKSSLKASEKISLYNKIFFSQFRFLLDIGLPILSIYLMILGISNFVDPFFGYLSIMLFIASIFILDMYGFMFRKLAQYISPDIGLRVKITQSVGLLLFTPFFIFIQAIPRIQAVYNIIIHPNRNTWYKTERTEEVSIMT